MLTLKLTDRNDKRDILLDSILDSICLIKEEDFGGQEHDGLIQQFSIYWVMGQIMYINSETEEPVNSN